MRTTVFLIAISLVTLSATDTRAGGGDHLYLAQRDAIPWQSLSRDEQDALRRYQNQWDGYSSERQREMRRGAQRYLTLPPQKRRDVEQRRQEYQRMSPEERRRLREEYKRERR